MVKKGRRYLRKGSGCVEVEKERGGKELKNVDVWRG